MAGRGVPHDFGRPQVSVTSILWEGNASLGSGDTGSEHGDVGQTWVHSEMKSSMRSRAGAASTPIASARR